MAWLGMRFARLGARVRAAIQAVVPVDDFEIEPGELYDIDGTDTLLV